MSTASYPTLSTGYSTAQDGTLVVWGTDGILQTPLPISGTVAGTGFYIVVSCDESEKVDLDYGENGTGIEMRRTILKHGKRWNLTVIDDLNMTAPSVGTTVTVIDIIAGGSIPSGGSATYTIKTATVIDASYRAAQKQPGQRVIQVENLTLVDPQ